ncbi:toll/interleukin-1 receptor domain-containing protein [Virgisporangium aurantiacum]|uniref:toll/interleukin-1 receptor domain-containing protein n=1 Tax=Virgisporangium aurantiacum TaxID=175570 RepID=UPI001951BF11|nr:toll/interleukin-1 receptor domain-containing protein [Virgisporangium aurantiacum]
MRAFISYAHGNADHEERVLQLYALLRDEGVDAKLDRPAAGQRQFWPQWIAEQIRSADFVLVVASPRYRDRAEGRTGTSVGRGVQWEARQLQELQYRDATEGTRKIIPVVLPGEDAAGFPDWLHPVGGAIYSVPELTPSGVDELIRLLTGQPLYLEPPLGRVRPRPPRRVPVPRRESVAKAAAGRSTPPEALTGDAHERVRAAAAEVAARAHNEASADADRGYRDGVSFIRELSSTRELQGLAAVGFDVTKWLDPLVRQWGRAAAGLDAHPIPTWAGTLARYLGSRADPIGYDEFAFRPSDAYVAGFGDGVRAVWQAAGLGRSLLAHGSIAPSTGDQPRRRYDPLRVALASRRGTDEVTMTFVEIEHLVGPLPRSARVHRAWWANDSKVQAQAWKAAGWRVGRVEQHGERVTFVRTEST